MTRRTERVGELIRDVITELITEDLRDPRIGFLTVTGVDVRADLRHAVISYTVLGDEKQRRSTMIALDRARPHLRAELAKRLRLKYIPDLEFIFDDSIDRSIRVLEVLSEINKEKDAE